MEQSQSPSISSGYVGRFAPSPTGPLHFGSLVTAVASYLDARSNNGKWLVRMEDLDRPRVEPGAANDIMGTLEKFGFEWDGEILYQSKRDPVYEIYAEKLRQQAMLYPCGCTRKEIQSLAHAGLEGPVYPGTCRNGLAQEKKARAWRVKVTNDLLAFNDLIQGYVAHNLAEATGDFILKRADGVYAYQLAVVVDDAEQGITHIVRGADLLNSTSRQIYLQQQLGFLTPSYAHVPLITDIDGDKLSKQNHAEPIDCSDAQNLLCQAMQCLGMQIPADLSEQPISDIWQWAVSHWQIHNVPVTKSIVIEDN